MNLFTRFKSSVGQQAGINPNLFIFFISLLIAGMLWLLVAFDKNYNTTIPLEIIFRDYPHNRVLKTSVPENPYIIANLRGWDIIKYKRINKKITLEIDLQDYNNSDLIILSTLRKNSMFSDLKVLKFYPDTIHIDFEKGSSKLVVVKPQLELGFEKEYGLAGPVQVIPAKILVHAAASVLAKIDTLYTEKIVLKDLKSTEKIRQKIVYAGSNVILDANEVHIIIPVDKYTEGEMLLPIEIKGSSLPISVIPDQAKITFNSPVSNYRLIDSSTFRLFVEADKVNPDDVRKLKVKVTINNSFIFNVRIQPEFVDFMIKK